ncbi:MAG TPA: diaminopimelate epimerase [Acetobacteraceae bacterium]|nr:diaminopimelate epimerase [Acetobacteraceae bacterium]
MRVPFRKMHGCGNDFVVFDDRAGALGFTQARAAALADRRTGIGCDQFIVMEPAPPNSNADVFMRIRNPDGTEAGACGNATRCVAWLLAEQSGRTHQVVRTVAGNLPADVLPDGRVTVDMGPARLDWLDIPLARPMDTLHLDLTVGPVADPAAASMGNPHATFFVPDIGALAVDQFGPSLEHDPLFPARANIGFAQVLSPNRIRLRVWERGAGLTLACGSGACAALVNAHRRGLTGRRATVVMDGGELEIVWRDDGQRGNSVRMTGPVATAFTGEVELDAFPS